MGFEGAGKTAAWVRASRAENVIEAQSRTDALVLLGSGLPDRGEIAELLERFRTPDGGYGKREGDEGGSVYHTYLAIRCYGALGAAAPGAAALRAFVESRACADGGLSEQARPLRPQTNATAAGLGVLEMTGAGGGECADAAAAYLVGAQEADGGWRAADRSPVSDLLSTFTACAALAGVGRLSESAARAAAGFAVGCERASGGFGAGPWDSATDPEYTFYGLGVRAAGEAAGALLRLI
jgi:geranylgeranyl transferase type-2 subunit beta